MAADIYLTTLARYEKAYRVRKRGKRIDDWKMTDAFRTLYAKDPCVKHLHVCFDQTGWKWT